jgi:hypothetical protein
MRRQWLVVSTLAATRNAAENAGGAFAEEDVSTVVLFSKLL